MFQEILTSSEKETRDVAKQFALSFNKKETIILSGNLGSGKTVFVKGIADAFNCSQQVTSPTFSLVNYYEGNLEDRSISLFHFDFYRLSTERDVLLTNLHDYLSLAERICVFEWGERFSNLLPASSRQIKILQVGNEQERKILFS